MKNEQTCEICYFGVRYITGHRFFLFLHKSIYMIITDFSIVLFGSLGLNITNLINFSDPCSKNVNIFNILLFF